MHAVRWYVLKYGHVKEDECIYYICAYYAFVCGHMCGCIWEVGRCVQEWLGIIKKGWGKKGSMNGLMKHYCIGSRWCIYRWINNNKRQQLCGGLISHFVCIKRTTDNKACTINLII